MAGLSTPDEGKKGSSARALHFTPAKDKDGSLITSSVKKQKKEAGQRGTGSAAKRPEMPQTARGASHVEKTASPELKRRKVEQTPAQPSREDKAGDHVSPSASASATEAQTANPPRPAPELPPGVPAPPIPQGRVPQPAPEKDEASPGAKSKGVLQSIFSPVFHLFQQPDEEADDDGAPLEQEKPQQQQPPSGKQGSPRRQAVRRSVSPEQSLEGIVPERQPAGSERAQRDGLRAKAEGNSPSTAGSSGASRPAASDGTSSSSTDGESETCVNVQPSPAKPVTREALEDSECESDAAEPMYVDDASMDEDTLEFDPYAFIKSLPPLDQCAPAWRRSLLPKQTRQCKRKTLVLDLDETLVHSTLDGGNASDFRFEVFFNNSTHSVNVRQRPHLAAFLERCAALFEVVVFTASQKLYAEQLLNILDPKRRLIRHRIFRDDCLFVEGNYLKDLTVLGRDLAHTLIVDNSPQAFGFQLANGVPIESWYDDSSDNELMRLLPFLESLVEVPDVRPMIVNAFKLHKLVAQAPRY